MSDYGVIFDMDGVLVDSYQAHYESWRMLAKEYQSDFTAEDFARTFGRTSSAIIEEIWPGKFCNNEKQEVDALKEKFYREIIEVNFPEMAGASDLLNALHGNGFRLAIGSSGPPENIDVVVNKLNAADLFDARITGCDVTRGKPDPQVFQLAAETIGIEPARCLVVEDAEHGVQAALAAGMKCVAITGTLTREKLDRLNASLVIDSLNEIGPKILRELIDS